VWTMDKDWVVVGVRRNVWNKLRWEEGRKIETVRGGGDENGNL
jgi:hypothetical protein